MRKVTFKDSYTESTWTYDPAKTKNGPVSVSIKYSAEFDRYYNAPKVKKQRKKKAQ